MHFAGKELVEEMGLAVDFESVVAEAESCVGTSGGVAGEAFGFGTVTGQKVLVEPAAMTVVWTPAIMVPHVQYTSLLKLYDD